MNKSFIKIKENYLFTELTIINSINMPIKIEFKTNNYNYENLNFKM